MKGEASEVEDYGRVGGKKEERRKGKESFVWGREKEG